MARGQEIALIDRLTNIDWEDTHYTILRHFSLQKKYMFTEILRQGRYVVDFKQQCLNFVQYGRALLNCKVAGRQIVRAKLDHV